MQLGTLLTAIVTPMNADLSVDFSRAQALAKKLVAEGSDGLVVAGTTGESPTLTEQEKIRLFEVVLGAVGDRACVVAGTGNYNTAESIHLTKEAQKVGAHAAMLVCPYYNKPPQEGLYQHFKAIADSTSLPIIIYNIPGRTSCNIDPPTVARLAKIESIVALKEASGLMTQVSQVAREMPPSFRIYSGNDEDTLPIMALGGVGVISVVSHLAGDHVRAMIDAFHAGDVKHAREVHFRLFPLFKVLFMPGSVSPAPVKSALRIAGFDPGPLRPPLISCTSEQEHTIEKVLRDLSLV